jgi:hypothetical protein
MFVYDCTRKRLHLHVSKMTPNIFFILQCTRGADLNDGGREKVRVITLLIEENRSETWRRRDRTALISYATVSAVSVFIQYMVQGLNLGVRWHEIDIFMAYDKWPSLYWPCGGYCWGYGRDITLPSYIMLSIQCPLVFRYLPGFPSRSICRRVHNPAECILTF